MHIVKLVFIENKKTDAITNSIILKPSLHVVLEKSGFIELISLVLANIYPFSLFPKNESG